MAILLKAGMIATQSVAFIDGLLAVGVTVSIPKIVKRESTLAGGHCVFPTPPA